MFYQITPWTPKGSTRGEIREKGSDDKIIKYCQGNLTGSSQNKEVSLCRLTVFVDALVHSTMFNFLKVR